MVGNVSMYDTGQIARGGYGPAGTGHPPPPSDPNDRQGPPTFEILGKGVENGHAAADRIESALDRIEPLPPTPSNEGIEQCPPSGHAQSVTRGLQHLVSRLHRLADRLEGHG